VAEATMIAPTPPDHGSICLAQCAVAHQLTPIGRWIEQRGDLGFGQLLSAHQPCLPGVKTGRPADPGRGVDERAASDAEDAANRGLGYTVVERSRTRYPWRIPAARRQSVLSLSAYATKIGRSLVPAGYARGGRAPDGAALQGHRNFCRSRLVEKLPTG